MHSDIRDTLTDVERVVIVQADNPDADSLGSTLALEHILGDLGKDVHLYCGVNMPEYLHYLAGWDRVTDELPRNFDASIIVDASTHTLFEKAMQSGQFTRLKAKPCIVLDHHAIVENPLDFTDLRVIDTSVASTGELIFNLSREFGWRVSPDAAISIMASILGDTQGLTNDLAHAGAYRHMADLIELGANRTALEELRREYNKMPRKIYAYKGQLLQRTQFSTDGRIAYITIPQAEINEYSPLYNPVPLVQFDMLQVIGVQIAVVFKTYDDGKITGAIRAVYGTPIAGTLAQKMDGGGHNYAAGFKITDGRSFDEVKSTCLSEAALLLGPAATLA